MLPLPVPLTPISEEAVGGCKAELPPCQLAPVVYCCRQETAGVLAAQRRGYLWVLCTCHSAEWLLPSLSCWMWLLLLLDMGGATKQGAIGCDPPKGVVPPLWVPLSYRSLQASENLQTVTKNTPFGIQNYQPDQWTCLSTGIGINLVVMVVRVSWISHVYWSSTVLN